MLLQVTCSLFQMCLKTCLTERLHVNVMSRSFLKLVLNMNIVHSFFISFSNYNNIYIIYAHVHLHYLPTSRTTTTASSILRAEGFGPSKPTSREKSDGQRKREAESSKYDQIASTGGQQYNVYVRQFGSDDKSWLPCGSIAVPRGAQVSDAVFANEQGLKDAITRTYPKLKGFEAEFEFGFNLKIYPDDPIDVAVKGSGVKKDGFSIGNWISTLLSPVDTSGVPMPPPPSSNKD